MALKIVILCGGAGLRLWPLSTNNLPKQYAPILENKTLLDLTLERVKDMYDGKEIIIVCNAKHTFHVKASLEKFKITAKLILEPEGKNTAPAIYLAARIALKNDDLLIMPSDHMIRDNHMFQENIKKIASLTSFKEWITLGVKPRNPSSAYGYIKTQKEKSNLLKAIKFIEKPTKKKAEEFLRDNSYYWNSGIFLGKSSMIIKSITQFAPRIAYECENALKTKKISIDNNEISFLPEIFSKIPSKSIDYAVLEHDKNIKLFPLTCLWDDLGSWDSIEKLCNQGSKDEKVVEIQSENNFIKTQNRVIATIGVKDLIIIDSDNATLIAKKTYSENVKKIVEILKKSNNKNLVESTYDERPWGNFKILLDSNNCKVKKLSISPFKRISLQFHNFRSEHWLIVEGKASIYLNGALIEANPGDSVDIPQGTHHYVENKNNKELIIIETQLGSYFGEDDIIRIEDPYNR